MEEHVLALAGIVFMCEPRRLETLGWKCVSGDLSSDILDRFIRGLRAKGVSSGRKAHRSLERRRDQDAVADLTASLLEGTTG